MKNKKVKSYLRNITYMSLSKVICPILKVFVQVSSEASMDLVLVA